MSATLTGPHGDDRRRARRPLRKPSLLQIAGGAFARLRQTVAERLSPPEHRAARADVAEAAGVRRGDDAGPSGFRRFDFVKLQSRHESMEVDDIGADLAHPPV